MSQEWSQEDWQTARLQVGAAFINNWWIKMGVCYGFAHAPASSDTRNRTDRLLAQLTDRVVFQCHGPRVLCGDFNQSTDALRQFAIWRAHGFIEIQELALQKWGRPIQPTCQGKSITDHVWVSRELWPFITKVVTDDAVFTDHAALWAELGNKRFDFHSTGVGSQSIKLFWAMRHHPDWILQDGLILFVDVEHQPSLLKHLIVESLFMQNSKKITHVYLEPDALLLGSIPKLLIERKL